MSAYEFDVDIFTGQEHICRTILARSSVQAALTALRLMPDDGGRAPIGIICKPTFPMADLVAG